MHSSASNTIESKRKKKKNTHTHTQTGYLYNLFYSLWEINKAKNK